MSEPTPIELFSQRMQAAMEVRGIKQAQLAQALNTSPATVNRWYNGGNLPDGASGTMLARELGVPREWLVKGATANDLPSRIPLREIRQRTGLSTDEFARLMGLGVAVLEATELGARPSLKIVDAIMQALPGVSQEELLGGSESTAAPGDEAAAGIRLPAGAAVRHVPLLSWAEVGKYQGAHTEQDVEYSNVLACEVDVDAAFAVEIDGDSMSPNIMPGDRVVVVPAWPARAGDTVIVRTTDGDVFCKLYTRSVGGKFVLVSINKDHPPMDLAPTEIAWMYPVAQVTKILRRR
jgi:phage repressor protein C with HTH and peptisase S24 domain